MLTRDQKRHKLLPNINRVNENQPEQFSLTTKLFLKKEISTWILFSLNSTTILLFGEVNKFYFAIIQKKRKIHVRQNLKIVTKSWLKL